MLYRMMKDLIIGVVAFLILSGGATSMFQEYLLSSGHFSKLEQKKVEEFQEYIDENQLKITDSKKIRSWIKKKNVREFIISKGTKIILIIDTKKIFFRARLKIIHLIIFIQ